MDELLYFLERMYHLTAVPVRCIRQSDGGTILTKGFETQQNPFDSDPGIINNLIQKLSVSENPILEFEDGIFLYGAAKGATSGGDACSILFGPVVLGEIDRPRIDEYAKRHGMEPEHVFIKHSTLMRFTSLMALTHFVQNGECLTDVDLTLGREIDADEASTNATFQSHMMDNAESGVERLAYADEKMFTRQIREGDLDGIRAYMMASPSFDASTADERVGQVARNKLKHYEYIVLTSIILASRAAIEGGMDALSAYALSEVYTQRLERSKTMLDMLTLSQEAQLDFAARVRKLLDSRSRSSYVEKCKSYIANHLNKPFTLEDIATAVGISRPYLSKRFAQEEGIGVMDYARNKRVEAAANMLKYSTESISAIASYLCFPSQSHFGAVFKKIMGVTPQRYRENQSLIDVK